MTWTTHTWSILENTGLVCRKSGEGTCHYQPPAWILTGVHHNRSIWFSGGECKAGWHTDTGDIILLRLLKGTSYGRGDEKLCWSAVSWDCWNQTWSIEKCLEERWKAPWFCGQRHSLWWHLLIFYICIDQFSIVLIPFLHGDNSIDSLCPEPRTELIEQGGAQEGCSLPSSLCTPLRAAHGRT